MKGPFSQLTLSDKLDIDRNCDRFEQSLRAGQSPRIEDYLDGQTDASRETLFRELIAIDVVYLMQGGAQPALTDYQCRFPSYADCLPEVLAQVCRDEGHRAAEATRSEAHQTTPIDQPSSSTLGGATGPSFAVGLTVGAPFGEYDILEHIGTGGMGIVYRAVQRKADRIVALKLIRPDRLNEVDVDQRQEAIERFRHEARAAARLAHDHIVTVYDVGECDGRHYYSMQYVEGRSLSDVIRLRPIEARSAAELMLPVCRAVAYAHDQHILHRDIKPNNILIGTGDRPYVADFGMAKSLKSEQTFTRAGPGMGTPAYMSPEQATDATGATFASDVYGLGATLYAMITGRPPFQAADPLVTLRQVLDDNPIRPIQLNPQVTKDLETICLRCLEKNPRQRYSTAGEVADELTRFLNHEPIRARPVGRIERCWRWCHRNPLAAGLSLGLAVMFLVGVTAVVWQWRAAVRNATLAQQQGAIAEQNYQRAREAVDYFTTLSEGPLLGEPGLQPLREELLQNALTYYEDFIVRHGDDPALQRELAAAYYRAGKIAMLIGSTTAADHLQSKAIPILERLAANDPGDVEIHSLLARCYNNLGLMKKRTGDIERARGLYRDAIKIHQQVLVDLDTQSENTRLAQLYNNLGIVEKDTGRTKESLASYRRSIQIHQQLVKRYPDDLDAQAYLAKTYYNLGILYRTLGEREPAAECMQEVVAILAPFSVDPAAKATHRMELAKGYHAIGVLLVDDNRQESGIEWCQKARDIYAQLAESNPAVSEYQKRLVGALRTISSAQEALGLEDAAARSFQHASQLQEQLIAKSPDETELLASLALAYNNRGAQLGRRNKNEQALEYFEEARILREQLVEISPTITAYWDNLARLYGNLSGQYLLLRDHDRSLDLIQRAIEIEERLVTENPEIALYQVSLGSLFCRQGYYHADLDQHDRTLEWFRRAIVVLEQVVQKRPDNTRARNRLATAYWEVADTCHDLEQYDAALAAWDHAIAISEPPRDSFLQARRAHTLARMGDEQRAVAAIRPLINQEAVPGETLMYAARVFGLAALAQPGESSQRQNLQQAARELLEQLAARGYFDTLANRNLLEHSDFESLRKLPFYRALLVDR